MSEKFKNKFDSWAESYDTDMAQFSSMNAKLLASCCGKMKGSRILDIGTGTGIVAFEFARRVGVEGEVTGIDISEKMLQKPIKKAKEDGMTNIRFKRGGFVDIPLDDVSVDVIVSSNALHHVEPKEKQNAFKEMWRVLKKDGIILINDFMYENADWRKIFTDPILFKPHLEKMHFPKEATELTLGLKHPDRGLVYAFKNEYTEDVNSIKKYAKEAGFRDIKIEPIIKPVPFSWILRAIK